MNITKSLTAPSNGRARRWAPKPRPRCQKTSSNSKPKWRSDLDGMERMQKSMNMYVKWLGRRGELADDKEKGLPASYLGRTMMAHGEEFQSDSEFGNCLIAMGRANERVSGIQESFVNEATATWLESLERSLAMMKEYQASRKKLESRRLAYDASITKMQKSKRDDFRLEEELRTAKAKYEESSEDVLRRMQDIRDAEVDSVRDLTQFMDAELDYHERCAEELRRVRNNWAGTAMAGVSSSYGSAVERRPTGRSRSNTARSYTERLSRTNSRNIYEADEMELDVAPPVRMPIRGNTSRVGLSVQPQNQQHQDAPIRPTISKANTFQGGASLDRERIGGRISGANTPTSNYAVVNQNVGPNVGTLRNQLRPVTRIVTTRDDVFGDRDRDDDTTSDSGSPDWANRSESPATSVGSLSRTSSHVGVSGNGGLGSRKAPPPPPPSRSKKPAPPVPARRELGY